MLRQLKNNNRGVVFVAVLMITLVMITITVAIVHTNISRVMATEDGIKRIQAEMLAKGMLAYVLANQLSSSNSDLINTSVTLGNVTFDIVANLDRSADGIYGTDNLYITIDY